MLRASAAAEAAKVIAADDKWLWINDAAATYCCYSYVEKMEAKYTCIIQLELSLFYFIYIYLFVVSRWEKEWMKMTSNDAQKAKIACAC